MLDVDVDVGQNMSSNWKDETENLLKSVDTANITNLLTFQ